MTQKEKLALLEDTFEVGEGSLKPEMLLENIEEYDSMAKLAVIVMMEDEFGVKLDSGAVKAFVTVGDIVARMNRDGE